MKTNKFSEQEFDIKCEMIFSFKSVQIGQNSKNT